MKPEQEKRRPERRLPPWLKTKIPAGGGFARTRDILAGLGLDTVCSEAKCPNRAECYGRGTATFLILGPRCTRSCGFCSVSHGPPAPPDPSEPERVAKAVSRMGVKHCVITSVTRDDLDDGGASNFAACVSAVRAAAPGVSVEILTPDFGGDEKAIRIAAGAAPDVYNHNVETVPSLYARVRPGAVYARSLALLSAVKEISPSMKTKSGLMLGVGEKEEEVLAALGDLRRAGVDFLTMGQYLKPAARCIEVERYAPPEEFEEWKKRGLALGFSAVAAGPLVRSSYRAEEML